METPQSLLPTARSSVGTRVQIHWILEARYIVCVCVCYVNGKLKQRFQNVTVCLKYLFFLIRVVKVEGLCQTFLMTYLLEENKIPPNKASKINVKSEFKEEPKESRKCAMDETINCTVIYHISGSSQKHILWLKDYKNANNWKLFKECWKYGRVYFKLI